MATKVSKEDAAAQRAKDEAEAVVEKRESYDVNKPAPAPVQIADSVAEVETLGEKSPSLVFTQQGSEVVATIGSVSVTLDREAILGVQRAFSKFGAQV